MTTLGQVYYVKETIGLMRQLMPDMKRLAFISDDRYISEAVRGDVEQAMTGSFPELAFEQLSTRNISTEMLLDTLKSYDKTTGLIIIPGSRLITRMITIICSIIFRRLLLASYIPSVFVGSRGSVQQYFRRRILCFSGVLRRFIVTADSSCPGR